jgi:hypothetical protein
MIVIYNDIDRNRSWGERYKLNAPINKDSVSSFFFNAIDLINYDIYWDENIEYLDESKYIKNTTSFFRIRKDSLSERIQKSNNRLILVPIVVVLDKYYFLGAPSRNFFKESIVVLSVLIYDNEIKEFIYKSSYSNVIKKETNHLTHEQERQLHIPHSQKDWDKLVERTMFEYIITLRTKK